MRRTHLPIFRYYSIQSRRLPFNLLVNSDVNEPEEWFQREAKPREKNKDVKINLIVQYYRDSSPKRQHELDECIRKNIANRYIDSIWMFLETDFDVHSYFKSEKIKKCSVLERRLKVCVHHFRFFSFLSFCFFQFHLF
jgi:hypothetical protein